LQSKVIALAFNSQVCLLVSPGDKFAQFYPQTSGSVFFALYNSQGYGGGDITRLHTRKYLLDSDYTESVTSTAMAFVFIVQGISLRFVPFQFTLGSFITIPITETI
jgi:hypothetical protein